MAAEERFLRTVLQLALNVLALLGQVASAGELPRQPEEDELLVGSGMNDSNSTHPPSGPPADEPVLSASAIANIICSGLAVIFLTAVLCVLLRSFNKGERKARLQTTLENNRRIDRQIAAAKARAAQRVREATELANQRSRQARELQSSKDIFEDSRQSIELTAAASVSSTDNKSPMDNVPLLSGTTTTAPSSAVAVQVMSPHSEDVAHHTQVTTGTTTATKQVTRT